jgi:methyl-accepting chemotaxis protein
MRLGLRLKILLPGAVVLAATVIAAGAAGVLQGKASAELDRVREVHLPAFDAAFTAGEAEAARAALEGALDRAKAHQRTAFLLGGALLVGAAVLAGAVALLVANGVAGPLETLSAAARRVADGDLAASVEARGDDETARLARSFGAMVERLRGILGELQSSSAALVAAADEISALTGAQGEMAERHAHGIAEAIATTQTFAEAARLAAGRAGTVLEVAEKGAARSAEGAAAAAAGLEGLRAIEGSVDAIVEQGRRLGAKARQVGEIVETVRELAYQSQVLSLNASIEAARAGEAGRGFAVVAAEVRALAEQSGKSGDAIARMLKDIQDAVDATLALTERGRQEMAASAGRLRASSESLEAIGEVVRETTGAATEIAGAVRDQSAGLAQISASMREVAGGTLETSERLQLLEAAAAQLRETAARISGIAAGFRVKGG